MAEKQIVQFVGQMTGREFPTYVKDGETHERLAIKFKESDGKEYRWSTFDVGAIEKHNIKAGGIYLIEGSIVPNPQPDKAPFKNFEKVIRELDEMPPSGQQTSRNNSGATPANQGGAPQNQPASKPAIPAADPRIEKIKLEVSNRQRALDIALEMMKASGVDVYSTPELIEYAEPIRRWLDEPLGVRSESPPQKQSQSSSNTRNGANASQNKSSQASGDVTPSKFWRELNSVGIDRDKVTVYMKDNYEGIPPSEAVKTIGITWGFLLEEIQRHYAT